MAVRRVSCALWGASALFFAPFLSLLLPSDCNQNGIDDSQDLLPQGSGFQAPVLYGLEEPAVPITLAHLG